MRKLLLAVVAFVGLGLAASPSLADHGHYSHRGHYGHGHHGQGRGHWDRHYDHYHYHVPRGCYGPRVYYNTPGFYYSGRNLSFGIGF